MNTDKETQIIKMLRFLKSKHYIDIREKETLKFNYNNLYLPINDKEYKDRDSFCCEIDFNEKACTWYAFYESYHNGDYYGRISGVFEWDKALDFLESHLRNLTERHIEQMIKEEELRSEQKIMKERVNNLMDKLLQ